MTDRRNLIIALVVLISLVIGGGLFFALSGDDDGDLASSTPVLTLTPERGQSGTISTVRLTGAQPNTSVTITYGTSQDIGTTDASGSISRDHEFIGVDGEQIRVDALVGSSASPAATATFTITPPPGATTSTTSTTTSTVPDPNPPLQVTLQLNPASGPSPTRSTITVDSAAGQPVTLTIGGNAQNGGTTDANGRFTFPFEFTGNDGDVITVTATVGSGASAGSASADFTITPTTAATSVSVDPASGPSGTRGTITVRGEPDSPVTLRIGASQTTGRTDASGTFTYTFAFVGAAGDVAIEATVGDSGSEQTATTSFEITDPPISDGPWIFVSTFGVGADPAGHAGPIGMPSEVDLTVNEGSITIEGPPPFVTVSGDLADDGTFSVAGSGNVAGFPDVGVLFDGTVTAGRLVGEYTMGTGGELPTGEPIVYVVESVGVVPPPPDLAEFYRSLSAALQAGDVDEARSQLHPAVLERYGSDACDAYLADISNPDVTLEFVEVTGIGPYDFPTDGLTTPVGFAIQVDVRVVGPDGESVTPANVQSTPAGTVLWFTDCGEPTG